MPNKRPLVTIKGKKSGLILTLNDQCSYEALLTELKEKLATKAVKDKEAPLISVKVETGYRYLSDEQASEIKEVIRTEKPLIVDEIESKVVTKSDCEDMLAKANTSPITKMVRSGQVLEVTGDLLLLGDVNPGGKVVATGNVYIMGALKGIAHAGCEGDESAVIAASLMKPMQLIIADTVSRSPDQRAEGHHAMEYAYIDSNNQKVVVDRVQNMFKQRMVMTSM